MKIAIYTANFGNYDRWREPKYIDKRADYYLFTDNIAIESNTYKVIYDGRAINPARQARRYKIIEGFEYLCNQGYHLIIWHDSNMMQIADLSDLIKLQITDIMLMKHPTRDCIYDEFHACNDAYPPKDDIRVMYNQVQGYANEGYPEHNGMVATGVLFRRNNQHVIDFMRDWWVEVEKGSIRDQLSFNYVTWKRSFKYDTLPFNDTLTYYFNMIKHIKR